MPIWARPAPGARRPRFTRAQIAEVALAIADAEGFEAVSMRRVADELGAGTMTLYHYVRTKADLVALMDDALAGEVVIPASELPTGWRPGMRAIAIATRAIFLRHPWALGAVLRSSPGPNAMRHVEQSLQVLAGAGLTDLNRMAVISIVDDYVFGHLLRAPHFEAEHAATVRAARAIREFLAGQLDSGTYPQLEAMMRGEDPLVAFARLSQAMTADAQFELGLDIVLDGLAARFGLPGAPAAPKRRRS